MKSQYCAVLALPPSYHHATDMVVSASLLGGAVFYADFISSLNPYIAFFGGLFGLFIGGVRVYEITKQYIFTKMRKKPHHRR